MKAVYYICSDPSWGHVAARVWNILKKEGYLNQPSGITFAGKEVMKYCDGQHEYYFVPTNRALCRDYPLYLKDMNTHFADCDMSAMVTWHGGNNAPDNVLTVHSLGDMNSGCFGAASPCFMRNLLLSFEKNRRDLGLTDYRVSTEATHWSGVHGEDGEPQSPELLLQYPVPMVDIEVGSSPQCWDDDTACTALARTLLHVFDDNKTHLHNILCVGGVHFEPSFADAVFKTWYGKKGEEAFGITHILANQWLVTGKYEEESGFEKTCSCINSIDGGIEAIFFHDKLKGCYKDLVRRLGQEFNIPVYKHQKLRVPEELDL